MNRNRSVLIGLLLCVSAGPLWDSPAVKKVREGVRRFSEGNYAAATEAFDEADAARPEDARIAFDRACSLAAQGQADEAQELFQQAALAREADLSAAAHYNMGNLAADQARDILGTDPVSLPAEQRPDAVSGLLSAVVHYRDCLRMNPDHADARHNLELIRLFIKHIESEWERRDREQDRDELGLLEFLAMLERRQEQLRTTGQQLSDEDDSPQHRQALREAAESQTKLQEEIGPLREKLSSELQAASGQSVMDPEQLERVTSLLHQLADGTGAAMLQAAEHLQAADPVRAVVTQREVLDQLNQIYMVIAPFDQILQKAVPRQERLVSESGAMAGPAGQEDSASSPTSPLTVGSEQAWKQSRISDWSRLLSLKAEAELPQLQNQLESMDSGTPGSQPPPAAGATGEPPAADPTARLQALSQAMQKAIELAPQVEELSASAENHLNSEDAEHALPDQQEALRLLKEIAEPLADQQDQNDQQQDQQDQQRQDQKDQQDQQGQNDQPQQDPQDSQQDSDDQSADNQQQQEQQQQSARQRAESVLRRARERERERRDLEKELRRILGGVISVDKDW